MLHLYDQLIVDKLLKLIKKCQSIRAVELTCVKCTKSLLDTMQKTSSVQQWKLFIHPSEITESFKNKLLELLSKRNDNSVFVYDR